MSRETLHIAIHNTGGLQLVEGAPNFGKESPQLSSTGKVKLFATSNDGKKFAFIANGCVQLLDVPEWKVRHSLELPTAQELLFSPGGAYLAVWCLYLKAKDGKEATPNLHIYDIRNGCKLLKSFFQTSQLNWHPQWTLDDSVFARNVTNEVHFYKADSLDQIAHKRVQPKLRSFSLSPSKSSHVVAFFTPSIKGAPCVVNLFKYPHFKDNHQPLTTKAFYKVDTIEFLWNKQCTSLLLMASEDKGDANSYYGEKMVFLLNTKNSDAIRVTFDKPGPVHSVTWTPDGKHFLAVFGSNPAKCSMFNLKGELHFSFDEGARNFVLVNPLSSLALVGGSGNISPRIEVWEMAKGTRLCYQECPDVTHMEWSPCGQYILTATCSPRLRVNNGYRIYHYSGSLQFEYLCPAGTDLYNAHWMPTPSAAQPFVPSTGKVPGIQSAVKIASTQRYIPPGQRKAMSSGDQMVETCKQFLRQIDKYDANSVAEAKAANQPPPQMSRNAARNKRRQKAKEVAEFEKNCLVIEEPEGFTKKTKSKPKEEKETVELTGDALRKSKAIKKKLQRIEKLKKEKAQGKTIDANQVVLLEGETALIAELKTLGL